MSLMQQSSISTPNSISKKYAIKRLMSEWRNYDLSPSTIKKNINIAPLEQNIFEWHGNLAPPVEHPYYSGCIFHFIIHFPEDYPKQPPSIELKTGLAHSNIIPKHYHHGRLYDYFLCMDVINNFFWVRNNGQQEYRGWSSAYSVETLLLQLYTFLFEERVENYDGEIKHTLYQKPPELGGGKYEINKLKSNLTQTWHDSKYFICNQCSHTYEKPYPPVKKSTFKELETINLRESPNKLKLILQLGDYITNYDIINKNILLTNSDKKSTSKAIRELCQQIWPPIRNQMANEIINREFDIYHVPKCSKVISCLFVNFKDEFYNQDESANPEITHQKNKIIITIDNSAHQLIGYCTESNTNFIAPDLLTKIIGEFFKTGFFLNDLVFLYENLLPNKLKYWEQLIGFKPINLKPGRYFILQDIYIAPKITEAKKARADYLTTKLGQLLTAAILNPNRYILSKWSSTIDELFDLLDINTDLNQEIRTVYDIITRQRVYKTGSGCPFSCKSCYPNGPPVLDENGEYEIPYADSQNKYRLCTKWLIPELFNLPKLARPENLQTLRDWYYLWLTKYSDIILDKLNNWGYDFKGRLITNSLQTQIQQQQQQQSCRNTTIESVKIELSETAKREVLDALTPDGRHLLACISDQFSKSLKSPEYREKTWLKCWTTGYTLTQDILGYPITITTFSKRGPDSVFIKEITSTLDIMSLTAYNELKIDRSVWNHEFEFFLPLYLTPVHFKKARLELMNSVSAIYFNRKLGDKASRIIMPRAMVINEIFATLLNSLIVEMMKGQTHISLKALEGFTQLFRTWYYLAESDTEIRIVADSIINDFISKSQYRHKRVTPNLGKLLMLVCISRQYSWEQIQNAYFDESRDRNILWILRACPDIISISNWYDIKPYLKAVLEATIVGKRLQIFNKYFTEMTKNSGFIESLDRTYGYPDDTLKQDFQQVMKNIYNMNSWDDYYKQTGMPAQTESELAHQIFWGIRTSTRKGYNIGIAGINQVLGSDVELLKIFESNYSLEEILDFFKKFRHTKIEA